MRTRILTPHDISPDLTQQFQKLYHQLSPTQEPMSLESVFNSNNPITIAYCKIKKDVVGIASLCIYTVMSGKKAWIEDVVVNVSMRGRGIGRKLMTELISVAKANQVTEILLFTEEHRKPAIQLYESLGFNKKKSNIYHLK